MTSVFGTSYKLQRAGAASGSEQFSTANVMRRVPRFSSTPSLRVRAPDSLSFATEMFGEKREPHGLALICTFAGLLVENVCSNSEFCGLRRRW